MYRRKSWHRAGGGFLKTSHRKGNGYQAVAASSHALQAHAQRSTRLRQR